jgi:rod shape-determining protein MreD
VNYFWKTIEQLQLTIALAVAIALQWSLRNVIPPMAYVDLPLIVIVYIALQRDAIRALIFASLGGIAIDAISGGMLGSSGFSKTLVAFAVAELARRVFLDNLLLRIPVLAGASLLDDIVYFAMHRLLGQIPSAPAVETIAYSMLGTTIVGTLMSLVMYSFFSDQAKTRRNFISAPKRQYARRNPIRLGRRA